jgi:hypothetical protein
MGVTHRELESGEILTDLPQLLGDEGDVYAEIA